MVELSKLTNISRENIKRLECPEFEAKPWVTGSPLSERRVAIVSSAGIHRRDDAHFTGSDSSYRAIPNDTDSNDIVMSHISLGYDRTAYQQDLDAILPVQHMANLADEGKIGSVASTHYSFMGGANALSMEPHARELAGALKADNVDAVVLLPV